MRNYFYLLVVVLFFSTLIYSCEYQEELSEDPLESIIDPDEFNLGSIEINDLNAKLIPKTFSQKTSNSVVNLSNRVVWLKDTKDNIRYSIELKVVNQPQNVLLNLILGYSKDSLGNLKVISPYVVYYRIDNLEGELRSFDFTKMNGLRKVIDPSRFSLFSKSENLIQAIDDTQDPCPGEVITDGSPDGKGDDGETGTKDISCITTFTAFGCLEGDPEWPNCHTYGYLTRCSDGTEYFVPQEFRSPCPGEEDPMDPVNTGDSNPDDDPACDETCSTGEVLNGDCECVPEKVKDDCEGNKELENKFIEDGIYDELKENANALDEDGNPVGEMGYTVNVNTDGTNNYTPLTSITAHRLQMPDPCKGNSGYIHSHQRNSKKNVDGLIVPIKTQKFWSPRDLDSFLKNIKCNPNYYGTIITPRGDIRTIRLIGGEVNYDGSRTEFNEFAKIVNGALLDKRKSELSNYVAKTLIEILKEYGCEVSIINTDEKGNTTTYTIDEENKLIKTDCNGFEI